MKNTLAALIEAAIRADVLTGEGSGFVSIMGKSSCRRVQQDIPAAFEAYTLLSRFLDSLPLRPIALDAAHPITDLSPTIFHDEAAARIVALLPIGEGELTEVAYWLTDSLHSDQVKRMAGILALPFSIENHIGVEHLLPEWFAAFYLHGEPEHCIPILTLRSVLADPRFGGDWVSVALERMTAFGLPQEQAVSAVRSPINPL